MALDISTTSSPVPGIGSPATQSGALTNATSALGKDQFLKLLMAQLQQQDPMNPMDNQEMVAQLAQFSALEQQTLTNQNLEGIQLAQMSMSNAQMAGFLGKSVVAKGDHVSIDMGRAQPVAVRLEGAAEKVKVTIKDASGKVVHTLERNRVGAGSQQFDWPGTDQSGNKLPDGQYTVSVEATDASGNPVTASTTVEGVVTGISYENGFAELLIGNRRVLPGDVISVSESTPAPSTNPGASINRP